MISIRRTCQKQICSPIIVVMNQKRNLDTVRLVSPPSFCIEVLGMLDEMTPPKPQDTFESAASQMLTWKQ